MFLLDAIATAGLVFSRRRRRFVSPLRDRSLSTRFLFVFLIM